MLYNKSKKINKIKNTNVNLKIINNLILVIELEEAMVEYDKIKSKMNTIKKKIEDITEGEPKEAKRLLNEATKKLEKTRIGINQINVDIKAAERYIIFFNIFGTYSKKLNSLFLLCSYCLT